jgi:hypothetical protein
MSMIARTTVMLGVVTAGFTSLAGGYPHSATRQVTEQHPPRVVMPPEPVSSTPKADRLSLFDTRFAQVRMIPLEKPASPPPTVRPESEPEPEHQHRHVEQHDERDVRPKNVCEHHHMHKEVTRGGRSWRCRR